MMLTWGMLLQATAIDAPLPPVSFDLAKLKPTEARCGSGKTGEIVVCGKSGQRDRLQTLTGAYAEDPVRAEVGLGGGMALSAHVEMSPIPGITTPRAMVTLTIPLGKKKARAFQ